MVNIPNHYAKLEFPKFKGDDVADWIFKAEQFFELDNTPEASKVRMAGIHFMGKATTWFKAYEKTYGKMILWKDFMLALHARFEEDALSDPLSDIKKLKKTGSLSEYLEQFDALLSKVDLNETQDVSHLLGGLKHEVELSVRLFCP